MADWRDEPDYINRRRHASRSVEQRKRHEQKIAAIDRLTNQLKTEQAQEQTDDNKRAIREKVTIGLLIATVIATLGADVIFYWTMIDADKNAEHQVKKMEEASRLVRDSNQINKQAMEAGTRAWVGPTNASIVGTVQIDKPVTVKIDIFNTGRQPARSFRQTVDPITVTGEGIIFDMDMAQYVSKCFATPATPRAQVVYPSSGFGAGSFEFQTTFGADKIDQNVIDGHTMLVVRGCLTYQTSDQTKHSSFCYFYKGGLTKPTNLNICSGSSDAE